jgi:hypothetical protein
MAEPNADMVVLTIYCADEAHDLCHGWCVLWPCSCPCHIKASPNDESGIQIDRSGTDS